MQIPNFEHMIKSTTHADSSRANKSGQLHVLRTDRTGGTRPHHAVRARLYRLQIPRSPMALVVNYCDSEA
jgi:hypothetical protein